MLQSVRDNMKGGLVASVVILFFVVPLVITGVGDGSFLGSVAGNDAAEVNGKEITKMELLRSVEMRKNQMLSQEGVDPTADYMKDENLRGPVLDALVRQAALVVSARDGGVAVADQIIDRQIGEIDAFRVDGKFDRQAYQRALRNLNYTPASFRNVLAEEMLSRQHGEAIAMSAFSTDKELDILVSLIQQKRSFFTLEVPKDKVTDAVDVTEEEIAAYYEENKANYKEAEKMVVNYIQLSVDELAKGLEVDEADIKKQYDVEIENFSKERSVEFEVAHILIENGEEQAAKVAELKAKLDAGGDFSELAAEYSNDLGSKDNGGSLGVLTPGMFPESFEQAVYALDSGEVSNAVETDSGTHFIKVVSKKTEEPPTFEERKEAIAAALKKVEAEQKYGTLLDQLGELTFTAPDLKEVAETMGLEVKTTQPFTRTTGSGIALNAQVRDAAFGDEVLTEGYNSKVLEVSVGNSVVVRKNKHFPERLKSVDEVKEQIVATLTEKETVDALQALAVSALEKLKAGESAEALAEAEGYAYKAFDKTKRATATADYQVLNTAFGASKEGDATAYETVEDLKGNLVVVGVTEILPGTKADMPEQQYKALVSQLKVQSGRFESEAFEGQVVESAEVEIF